MKLIGLNVILRLAGMTLRFLLVFLLAQYLTPGDVGNYGLLAALISYSVFLIGWEFYNYSIREIIRADNNEARGNVLKHQFILYAMSACVLSPVLIWLVQHESLDASIAWMTVLVIIPEQLAQELNRILNALSQQLKASLVLFIRLGGWVLPYAFIIIIYPNYRTLNYLLIFWSLGNFGALVLAFYFLRKHICFSGSYISYKWILSGLKVSLVYVLGAICIKTILILDKNLYSYFFGNESLGVYIFYVSGAVAIHSIVDAAVYVFHYPSLVKYANSNEPDRMDDFIAYYRLMRRKAWGIGFSVTVVAIAVYYVIGHFLSLEVYLDDFYIGLVLFLAFFVFTLSMSSHYALYALGKDKSLNFVNFSSLVAFAGLSISFGQFHAILIPIFLLLAMSLLFLGKSHLLKKVFD